MSYLAAINKAWEDLADVAKRDAYTVKLLSDTYDINIKAKSVVSNSCSVPAKEYLTILLLHYLISSLKKSYSPSGEWISFKELEGGEIYYPAFQRSVVGPLLRKYGNSPENILSVLERFGATKINEGDIAIELVTFSASGRDYGFPEQDVAIRIVLWRSDSEFGPEATILFDKNFSRIYSTEDIAVFSRFIISSL